MAVAQTAMEAETEVFVRIKPPHEPSGCLVAVDSKSVQHLSQNGGYKTSMDMTFDKVFDCDSTQEQVFESVMPAVRAAKAGYRAGILAYGQTGSGKTHTLLGHIGQTESAGVVPRAVYSIFEDSESEIQV